MKNKKYWPSSNDPVWLEEGYRINESVFCETFISTHKIVFCNGFFFTEDGRVTDEMPLRSTIYAELKDYASNNVARKVGSILDLLKLSAQVDDFPPVTNCIHLANGTLNSVSYTHLDVYKRQGLYCLVVVSFCQHQNNIKRKENKL